MQLARHSKTGLLLLCVSQFGVNVTERHRKFALHPEVIPKRTPKNDKCTVSIPCTDENSIPNGSEDGSAYMLSELVKDTEGQKKHVLIATLGLEKLESSRRGRGTYKGLTKLFKSMTNDQSYDFTLSNESHEDTLLESLRQNFESLREYKVQQILFLDCREMHDPGKDRSTRDHLGTYPRNLHSMILDPNKNHKWMAFAKEVAPPSSQAHPGQ